MPRRILEGEPARRAIARGAEQLARVVRVTLGPRGRTVLIERGLSGPAISNDGVAVAREVELADPFENLGARLVREAAQKTFADVGDGTSTATVLAQAIVAHGFVRLTQGAGPVQLKRGIDHAARAVGEHLRAQARPLATREERRAVAAIASGGDLASADLVEDALTRVGPLGAVSVRESHAMTTRVEFAPGLRFDRGYLSAYFVTAPEAMQALLEQPLVLVADRRLDRAEDVARALEIAQAEGHPLLVVAEDVEGEALATLVVNQLRGLARACAVQAPGAGGGRRAWLEDLALVSGATLFADDLGRAAAGAGRADLGRIERALIERDDTTLTFLAGTGEGLAPARARALRAEAKGTSSRFDRARLEERAARLSGGVAVIEVGALDPSALLGTRARIEDALLALRSAMAEGVVVGGGVALLRARDAALSLPLSGDAKAGAEAVAFALLEPARWIARNAGADGDAVVAALQRASGSTGFDAALGSIVDLGRAGILDPARVTRAALGNAASVAGLLLTTETLVIEDESTGADPAGDPPDA